jgi:hypothetical protein
VADRLGWWVAEISKEEILATERKDESTDEVGERKMGGITDRPQKHWNRGLVHLRYPPGQTLVVNRPYSLDLV